MSMKSNIRRLLRDCRGATAIEYGLILAMVFLAMIGAAVALGNEETSLFNKVASTTVTATTLPSSDTTPPSAPTLDVYAVDSCEVFAQWTASSDNQSEPAEIRYMLFVNDDPNPTEVVMGITRTVAYGNATGDNTFVLKAIDAAGNVSVSNPVTLQLWC